MNNIFSTPEGHEAIETSTLTKGSSWRCQEPGCGQTTIKPYRWVVGSKTTFACDSCNGKVKEIGREEPGLEEVMQKITLLEKYVKALHQRMDDQIGKP
jgi:hypothetical protein